MPNQTLTLVSGGAAPSGKGFEFVDSDGAKWWMPPEDRDTKASNEPVAKELIPLFGKPAEYAVWVKDDGSARMIFGKAKERKGPGGGGFASWRNTEVGARFEQDNMNKRTALMCAKELATEDHEAHAAIVLAIAEDFYRWLSSVGAGAAVAQNPGRATVSQPEVAGNPASKPGSPAGGPAPTSSPVAAPAVAPPSADGNGASAERGEQAISAPLSRSASQQEAWTRYTTALTARGASIRQDLKAVRDLYVRPYCSERGLDFPPSQSWTAERLDAIAELLELNVALGAK